MFRGGPIVMGILDINDKRLTKNMELFVNLPYIETMIERIGFVNISQKDNKKQIWVNSKHNINIIIELKDDRND